MNEWIGEIEKLSEIADSQPHAVYAAMTHGFTSKWSYLARTTPNIGELLTSLEQAIRSRLIPKLAGREVPNDSERCLFALPTRLGGLNLTDPAANTEEQFIASKTITKPLVDLIAAKNNTYPCGVLEDQINAKMSIKAKRREQAIQQAVSVRESLPQPLQLAMEFVSEKGASS